MTVVAAEAIPAAESVTTTTASTAASASTAGKSAGAKAGKAPPKPGLSTRKTTRTKQKATAREVTYTTPEGKQRTAQLPEASVPEHTWHRWIMAEFVIAVVLVGASPFLRPGGVAGAVDTGVGVDSPGTASLAAPLVRLTAVSLIYFILALMAQGPRSGKIAAAFGALVLLGAAFNSLPEFVTLTKAFGGKVPKGVGEGISGGPPPEVGGGGGTGRPDAG